GYVARLIVLITKIASLTSRNPLPICCPPTMMSCFPTLSISPTVTADMIVGTVEYWYDCWREIVDQLQVQVLIIPYSTSVVHISFFPSPAKSWIATDVATDACPVVTHVLDCLSPGVPLPLQPQTRISL